MVVGIHGVTLKTEFRMGWKRCDSYWSAYLSEKILPGSYYRILPSSMIQIASCLPLWFCSRIRKIIEDGPRTSLLLSDGMNGKRILLGLPWWCSGWESACQCRRHRFEPWSGKIPHAAEQPGPWATTTEPACLEPVLRNKRGRDSERPTHRDEEWPPLAATRESPRTEMKTQHSQK